MLAKDDMNSIAQDKLKEEVDRVELQKAVQAEELKHPSIPSSTSSTTTTSTITANRASPLLEVPGAA